MITLTIIWWQVLAVVAGGILLWYLCGFLKAWITTAQWYIQWQFKRQMKAQKGLVKSKKDIIKKDLEHLKKFITHLNRSFPNSKARKQFWKDAGSGSQILEKVIDTELKRLFPSYKIIKKENQNEQK